MAQGFKTFVAETILTAADVNDYLMKQACMVFPDAATRDSNLTGGNLREGMICYITGLNQFQVYGDLAGNGDEWTRLGTKAEVDAASAEIALIEHYMEVM